MKIDNASMLLMKQIPLDGIGIFKQPTLEDILNIGIDNFEKTILPYRLTLDMLHLEDEDKSKFTTFDMFFIKDINGNLNEASMLFLSNLLHSLDLFFGIEDVKIDYFNKIISLDDKNYINNENFDILSDLVLRATKSKKIEVEKEDPNKSARKREIDRKLAEGRRRKEQREAITLLDMVNIIIHSGKVMCDYNDILKWTYLQIINSYEVVMNIEGYVSNLSCLNGFVDTSSLDLVHWSEKIRELRPKMVEEGTL